MITITGIAVVGLWLVYLVRKTIRRKYLSNEWWADRARRETNHSHTVNGPSWNWDEVKKHDGWNRK